MHTNRIRRNLVQWGAFPLATLAAQLGLAHDALASAKSLAVPYFTQGATYWCSMASAEMILGYYGATVKQTEIADYDFGLTNCDQTDPTEACDPPSGASDVPPMNYYGLATTIASNQFSFAQYQAEIDAGRPVSLGYNWNPPQTGGHVMVLGGYDTAGSLLEVWDPQPGAGCPGGETICKMTYAQFTGGAGYDHTAQAPVYGIKPDLVCSADYFDIPQSTVQQCADQWTHRNKMAAALTATSSGGQPVYAGSYQAATSAGAPAIFGVSTSDYESFYGTMLAKNYRPSQVSVVEVSGAWQISAIFQPAEGTFVSGVGMNPLNFQNANFTLTGQGYVIEDLFMYDDAAGNAYVAATWVKSTTTGQSAQIGISASEYESVFNVAKAVGKRPLRISSYGTDADPSYAVIWTPTSGSWYSENGWAESTFVSDDAAHTAAGLRLVYVSALDNIFNGVWTQ